MTPKVKVGEVYKAKVNYGKIQEGQNAEVLAVVTREHTPRIKTTVKALTGQQNFFDDLEDMPNFMGVFEKV